MALKNRRTQKNKTNRDKRGGKKVGKKTKKSLRNKRRQSRRVGGAVTGVKRNASGKRKRADNTGRGEQRRAFLRGQVETADQLNRRPENGANHLSNSNYENPNNSDSENNDDEYENDNGPNPPPPVASASPYPHGYGSDLHAQEGKRRKR